MDERYFGNDLDDFLLGKQELYCNFLHTSDPKLSERFWTVLGNTFLNQDIVIRKFQYHFERAKQGVRTDSVLGLYGREG